MPVINGVTFYEDAQEPKSPNHQSAVDNGRVTRSLVIRDATNGIREKDIFAAKKALLGYPVASGAGFISRVIPDSYPAPTDLATPTGQPYLWATSVPRTEPLGKPLSTDANGAAVYHGVRLTIQYNLLEYLIFPDGNVLSTSGPLNGLPDEGAAIASGWLKSRYVTRAWKGGGEVVTLPPGALKRVLDGVAVNRGVPMRVPKGIARYTWMQVPISVAPFQTIQSLYHNVNLNAFDSFTPGTLLFDDMDYRFYVNWAGERLVDITYTMLWRPNFDQVDKVFNGWNSFYQVSGSGKKARWRYLVCTTDGNPPDTTNASPNTSYPYGDFANLFRGGP
jgi:hypothetical protein